MDHLTRERRSWNMSRISGRNTRPELVVRSVLHCLGYRFRVHVSDLPGRPDIVLPRHRIAVLVHGCFWHRHAGCRFAYQPKSHVAFWSDKFDQNVRRDSNNKRNLRRLGWHVVVVWECQTSDRAKLKQWLTTKLNAKQVLTAPRTKQADNT